MESFILSVNVVAPLFFMMATGFLLKKVGLFDRHTLGKMNSVGFNFFLPLLMFYNTYNSNISESFDPMLMIFGVVTVAAIWGLGMLIVPRVIKDNPSRGVMVQAMFRSNFILFAIPVIRQIYGEGNAGVTDIMVAVIVPLYNVLAVVTFELFRGGRPNPKKILLGIVKNPLIVSSALGIACQLAGVKFFSSLEKTIADISGVATPLALIILGGFFEFGAAKALIKRTLAATGLKLFIAPAIFLPIAIAAGFRGPALATLFVMYGAPVAVSSFTMAAEMEGNGELASQITVFTSLGAVLSIFLGVFLLRSLGFI